LDGCSTIGDSRTYREVQFFGEALVRAVAAWKHREQRRQEGLYSPETEQQARHISDRFHVPLARARLIASLMGGGVE
jgi:hypothetical protein